MASHEAEIVDGSIKSLADIGRYVKALTPWRGTVPSIKDFASDIGSDLLRLTPSLLYHEVKQTAQQAFFDFNAQAYEHDKWGRPYNGSEVIGAAENGAVGGAFDHVGGLVIGYAGKVLNKPIESLANSSSQALKKSAQDLKKFSSNRLGLNKFATYWKSNSKWKLHNPNGSLTTSGKVLSRTNEVASGAGRFAAKGARESILNMPVGAGAAAVQDKVTTGSVTQPNQSEGVISDPESGVLNAIGNGYFGAARKGMNPGNEVLDASILKIQNALKNLAVLKSGKFSFVQQINLVHASAPGASTSTGTASSTTPSRGRSASTPPEPTPAPARSASEPSAPRPAPAAPTPPPTPVSSEPRTPAPAPAIADSPQHQPSDTTPAHPDPANVPLPPSRPPTPHPADVPLPPSRPASAPPDLGRNLPDTVIISPRAPASGGIPAPGPDAPAHAGPAVQDSGPPSVAAVGNASPGPQGAAGPGQQSSVVSASPSGDDTSPGTTEPGAGTSSPAPGSALLPSGSAVPPPYLATPPSGTGTEGNSAAADQQTGPDGKPKEPSVLTQPLTTVLKKPTAPGPGPDGAAGASNNQPLCGIGCCLLLV
jgi:hypothetical protein